MSKKDFLNGYKTYDTSEGFGNSEQWKSAFERRFNFKKLSQTERRQHDDICKPLYAAVNLRDLRLAYIGLIKKYHPDVAGDTQENKIISQAINDTYFILKNKL